VTFPPPPDGFVIFVQPTKCLFFLMSGTPLVYTYRFSNSHSVLPPFFPPRFLPFTRECWVVALFHLFLPPSWQQAFLLPFFFCPTRTANVFYLGVSNCPRNVTHFKLPYFALVPHPLMATPLNLFYVAPVLSTKLGGIFLPRNVGPCP